MMKTTSLLLLLLLGISALVGVNAFLPPVFRSRDAVCSFKVVSRDSDGSDTETNTKSNKSSRKDGSNPRVSARVLNQERAIANKQKNESPQTKKRRMMMFMKEKQQEKKIASRIARPLGFDDRTPLATLIPGMEVTGIVISLTAFGAYIDVGTECDGLLHISQMSRDQFVTSPKQMVQPGQEVTVLVRSLNAEKKKLHLTMLPQEFWQAEEQQRLAASSGGTTAATADRIALEDIQIDDELWGELRRVTDYGAYVEVGAAVHGFLHFMDHPGWCDNAQPAQFMKSGDRVRVWVSGVELEPKPRLKLTANRPPHLPGPRRDF